MNFELPNKQSYLEKIEILDCTNNSQKLMEYRLKVPESKTSQR
jgi:hypothetical protein